jgi:protein involved in temperature-dependent protein secretion
MTVQQLIEQGDFQGALRELQQVTTGAGADPESLLSRFNLEVRLQQFEAAHATARRLGGVAPQIMPVLEGFVAAARAEEQAARRLTDPALAGKRSTVGLPPPFAMAYAQMAVAHAQRDAAGAQAAQAEARKFAPPVAGTIVMLGNAEKRFVNLVDSDDLTGPTLPCYAGDKLLDLPYCDLREIAFGQPRTSFDMMWMPATVTLVDGRPLSVRIPTLYPGSALADEPFVRTGQETMWSRDRGYAQALGQRDLSATNADGSSSLIGIQRIAAIRFDNPTRALVPGGAAGVSHAGAAAGMPSAGLAWTPAQKAVAGVGAVLFIFPWVVHLGFLAEMSSFAVLRAVFLLRGLACCACAGWVASQRAGRNAGLVAAGVIFLLTTLKWLL